jgi:hypothetical protein
MHPEPLEPEAEGMWIRQHGIKGIKGIKLRSQRPRTRDLEAPGGCSNFRHSSSLEKLNVFDSGACMH